MSSSTEFDGDFWDLLKKVFTYTVIVLSLIAIAGMIISGNIIIGILPFLMLMGIALGISLVILASRKFLKAILFEIQIRL